MKKEISQLIFNISEAYFRSFDFKVKKNNQGGIEIHKGLDNIKIEGGFGFKFNASSKLEYFGFLSFRIRFLEVEEIRNKILLKHGIEDKTFSTIRFSDEEWRRQHLFFTLENIDLFLIEAHTLNILNRFESYMMPLLEQYLSLLYWANYCEKWKDTLFETHEVDSFYNFVNNRYNLKHLIILKLCGSPFFEEAFEYHIKPTLEYLDEISDKESNEYIEVALFRNILLDLKEILDATPPKYDLHDLTPPFRFEKIEVVKSSKPDFQPEVILRGKKVKIDINGFEISTAQKLKIDTFLLHLETYYDKVITEIISNAEYENESGDYTNDCGGTLFSIAEEAGLIETKPKGFEQEAAGYLYLRDVAIDLENETAVFYLASDLNDLVLSAHVTLDGRVEIIHL